MAEPDDAWYALVARLAQNEYALGQRYAEWAASAPPSDSTLTVAMMARQEWDHAHALAHLIALPSAYYMAADGNEQRPHAQPIPFLRKRLQNWADFVAVSFLFDGALSVIFASALESSHATFTQVAQTILHDEQAHAAYAIAWVKRLGREGGPLAQGIEAAIIRIWNETFCWFGPQEDPAAETLYQQDVLDAMPDVLRARLLSHIGPPAQAAQLHLPLRQAPQGNAWQFNTPLPWDRWDATTWQLESRSSKEIP